MEAIAFLAEDFMKEVACAIDHLVLLDEFGRGIHATKELDDAHLVEAVDFLAQRLEKFCGNFTGRIVALFDGDIRANFTLEGADLAGEEKEIPRLCGDIEVALVSGRFKFDSEFLCFCFC